MRTLRRRARTPDDDSLPGHAQRRQRSAPRFFRGPAITLLAAVLLPWMAATAAQAQISAAPTALDFTATRGEQTVTIANRTDEPISLRYYVGDFQQDERGGYRFLDAGETPRSCAARVRLDANVATIPPRSAERVRVAMEAGDEVCWSMFFIEAEPRLIEHANVRARPRLAVKVYGVPSSASREGEVTHVAARATAGEVRVAVEFTNLGEAPLRPSGYVEIHSLTGQVLASQPIQEFGILPGHRRELTIAVEAALPAGEYLTVPVLDFGAEYLVAGRASFRIQ